MKFKIIKEEQTPEVETFIHFFIDKNYKLMDKFLAFARRQHNCVGLAANQVSFDGGRLMKNFFAIKINHVWDIVIDPYISGYVGKKIEKIEGCLTWPGKQILAERYYSIDVDYYNLKGENIQKRLSDFEAQVWQHEYNHLRGIEEKVVPASHLSNEDMKHILNQDK